MLIKALGFSLFVIALAAVIVYEQRPSLSFDEYSKTRELAMSLCSQRMAEQPKVEFATDGCTLWPDKFNDVQNWGSCCVRHDVDYWCGGTSEERLTSDTVFRECVKKSSPMIATIMFYSSRLLGHPMAPVPWRFGWGHADYPRGYEGVSDKKYNSASDSEEASSTPNTTE